MVTSSLPGIPGEDVLLDWSQSETAATKATLVDPVFEADRATLEGILTSEADLPSVARRGNWLYNYRQTASNPRGVWQRVPDGTAMSPDMDWKTVFDLDAFCAQTGQIWHWRGTSTAWFDTDKILLQLALNGSDQVRYLEFDLGTVSIVEGGFDLGPARLDVEWLDADTLLVSESITEGAATVSGWPRRIRQLGRNGDLAGAPVVFEADKDDLLAFPDVTKGPDGRSMQVFTRMRAIGQSECTLRREGEPDLILPMPPDTSCHVSTHHFAFVIKDQGGTPGALMLGQTDGAPAREIQCPPPGAAINDSSVLLLDDWMIWQVLDKLRPVTWVLDLNDPDAKPRELPLPWNAESQWVYTLDQVATAGDGTLLLSQSGFLTPRTLWQFSLADGIEGINWTQMFQNEPAFSAPDHEVHLHWATSEDGTQVPYHLVAPRGASDVPTLIYGYGGYGVSLSPWYDRTTGKLWLEKGGAYVLACIRGGAELGPDWHLQAKGAGRAKAFEDFVAISRDLVKRGVTTPDRVACHGGSNGGLLCGVMLTRYPEDFGAVWASVGVYDMLKFHEFEAGAAWIDEYGDPDDPEAAVWLREYSPLHNVVDAGTRSYPPALVDTSTSDDRVHPSHSRWFGWQLQTMGQQIQYVEHGDGGHGGGGAASERAAEQALGYAFLRHTIGAGVMDPG